MTRLNVLKSPSYWITRIQLALYNCAEIFMKDNKKNRTQLAQHLGVSKGYVTQLLNGDYDHKLSKLVELSLAFGYVPKIDFIPVEEYYIQEQSKNRFINFQFTENQEIEKSFRISTAPRTKMKDKKVYEEFHNTTIEHVYESYIQTDVLNNVKLSA